ncbi:MAG: DMT family transporter [Salinivirgaceae bacterium]|jgi:drug/metabolite transporter (DMT)-like permease|nr:DMT family transporter [Salinivirgaceae bacterium]
MWFLFAITSALLSATAAILEKKELFKSDALHFSFILALFNAVLSLPFLINEPLASISTANYIVIGIKSFLGSISFLLVMMSIKRMELSSALPLLVLTPAVVAVFAWLFLNEPLTQTEISGMALLLIGTYFLQTGSWKGALQPIRSAKYNKGYAYIAGAIAIFSLTSLLDKLILGSYKVSPETYMPLQHIFMALFFSIMVLFARKKKPVKKAFAQSWKLILLISVITIAYRYSHIWAIKTGAVALALSVKRTSVFFAALIGGTIFKETNIPYKAVAVAIMVAGAIFVLL